RSPRPAPGRRPRLRSPSPAGRAGRRRRGGRGNRRHVATESGDGACHAAVVHFTLPAPQSGRGRAPPPVPPSPHRRFFACTPTAKGCTIPPELKINAATPLLVLMVAVWTMQAGTAGTHTVAGDAHAAPTFVGAETCVPCHRQ